MELSFDKDYNVIVKEKNYFKQRIIDKLVNFAKVLNKLNENDIIVEKPLIVADEKTIYNEFVVINKWIDSCETKGKSKLLQLQSCRNAVNNFKRKYNHSFTRVLEIKINNLLNHYEYV